MQSLKIGVELREDGQIVLSVTKEITENLETRLKYLGLLRVAEEMVRNVIPPKEVKSPITVVGPNGMPRSSPPGGFPSR